MTHDHPGDGTLLAYHHQALAAPDQLKVHEHLRACEACRAELQTLAETDGMVRAMPRSSIGGDFAARVTARATAQRSPRSWSVAAAGILMVLSAFGGWSARGARAADVRPIVRSSEGSRFMLMFVEDMTVKSAASDSEATQRSVAFVNWLRESTPDSVRLGGAQLVANDERRYGTDRDSATSPLQFTGFIVVRASSHDEVAAYARRCPIIALGGRVLVRQLR